ncbi:uncharacterized protein LOC112556388 isoform X2 [Pomacea canaliculata]|uniref:uncharacterized protein LOC112556388 isoform X2 n=1 Tax=Pomacea canaliculata TaxID=400727 RepID=UPI000D736885|nr:uncharacterized protein LOC112556388 isoform X2 [Pomacea canaliculata]
MVYRGKSLSGTKAMSLAKHAINRKKAATVNLDRWRTREKNFVLDSVAFTRYQEARKLPIIPPYDAMKDKYAVSYFESPAVKAIAERNSLMKELYREKAMRSLLNKKQCHVTPSSEELSRRRENFVNDAVMTDRMRTKFRDIIPPYRAEDDEHCRTYFRRKDVQKLLKITLSPRF